MMRDTSADDSSLVGPDRVRVMVQGLLRAAATSWTDEALGAATGMSPRRIKSYRVEGKEPSLSAALSIAVVLGKPAVNTFMSLIGYTARPLEEGDDGCPMQRVATTMSHLSTIATAAADGRIDHTEQPATQLAADAIIAELIPLSSHANAC